MSSRPILVLGESGMLGSAVAKSLRDHGLQVFGTSRLGVRTFDFEKDSLEALVSDGMERKFDYVINCIGLTKTHIKDGEANSVAKAINLNCNLPLALQTAAVTYGFRVIQVATDCVFSGRKGDYVESDPHDATDVYGKTKSLGEIISNEFMILRCSLIGPEASRKSLFFEWVNSLPMGSKVPGFVNHQWNGLTSAAFGDIVSGIITQKSFTPGVQHLVPLNSLSKYELVQLVARRLSRMDLTVVPVEDEVAIDRTLDTLSPSANLMHFQNGGFGTTPDVREIVATMPIGRK